jgi:hypothetical protein
MALEPVEVGRDQTVGASPHRHVASAALQRRATSPSRFAWGEEEKASAIFLLTRERREDRGRWREATVGASAGGTIQLELNRPYAAGFVFAGMNLARSQARNGAS